MMAAAVLALVVIVGGALADMGSEETPRIDLPGYAQGYEDGREMNQRGLYSSDRQEAQRRCNHAASAVYISDGELQQEGWHDGCLDGLQGNPRRD